MFPKFLFLLALIVHLVLVFGQHEKTKVETTKTIIEQKVTYEEEDDGYYDDFDDSDDDVVETKAEIRTVEERLKELYVSFEKSEQKFYNMQTRYEEQTKKINTMYSQLVNLTKQVSSLQESIKNSSTSKTSTVVNSQPITTGGKGVTYIRWGRTKCNDTTSLLYFGYAATGRWNQTGGGSDYLCMPPSPQGAVKTTAVGTRLHGIEYDFHGSPFSAINNRNQSFYYNDMPCALCHAETRGSHIMVPGKNTCPSGWTREYTGYLISSWYKNSKSLFYCLDGAPEVVPGGSARADTAYAHPVDVQCGPLPCPSYGNGDRVACVVCTK